MTSPRKPSQKSIDRWEDEGGATRSGPQTSSKKKRPPRHEPVGEAGSHMPKRRLGVDAHLVENANTFEAVALEWLEKKKSSWTPSYARQVERFLSADVFRYVGTLPIRTVTAAQLLEIVRRVEARGAETVALLLRQWTSAIFRYAVATLRADQDPAAALRGAIHRPKTRHHKPLSRDQIGKVLQALQKYAGAPTTIIAMRLMLLTFVRTKELREAEWCEFDFDRSEWRIPAERMKKRQQHIVPLSRQSLELLHELFTHTGNQRLLFPNFRKSKRLHDSDDPQSSAGADGIQRQRDCRLFDAWVSRNSFDNLERIGLSS